MDHVLSLLCSPLAVALVLLWQLGAALTTGIGRALLAAVSGDLVSAPDSSSSAAKKTDTKEPPFASLVLLTETGESSVPGQAVEFYSWLKPGNSPRHPASQHHKDISLTSSISFLPKGHVFYRSSMQQQLSITTNKSCDFYLLPTAVVTDDIRVVFTEGGVEIHLPEVGQELNPPAVHHILAVVDHAVQVVEVGLSRVAVPILLH